MKIYETLARIGIPEQASKIYLALLEYGSGNISDIARHTELHRSDVYRFLPLLEDGRLVTKFLTGKRTYYRANDPKHLRDAVTSLESHIDIIIETLQASQKKAWESMFEYGRWVDAIRTTYERGIDDIPEDGTIYRYSSRKRDYQWVVLSPEYKEKRRKKWILRKVITNEYQAWEKSSDPMREVAVIPTEYDIFEYDITKSIVWDTLVIVDYETLETYTIQNAQLAKFERKIFELLFRKL